MKLPQLPYADGIQQAQQTEFGGLNHTLGAGDGELYDMVNLTGDYYPMLASRRKRMRYRTLEAPGGLFAWDKLAWVDGDGFYYAGERKGTVAPGQKTFAALGAYIVIFPDKAYYNTRTGDFGSMESVWKGASLTFTNGLLYGEAAECSTIQCAGVNWADYFKAGDAVTIEGCTAHPENNKTPIIREIDGDKLYFYEYVFALDGDEGAEPCTETGELTVKRTVPDLLYLCQNENRLWGCTEDTIYSSKLGDIFNWNVYDGVDTDSYAVTTGSPGKFTAAVSYLGYPIFFKEHSIYKVYGSIPSNFEVMGSATLGVAAGSEKSLAIAGEMLFYLSPAGMMAYSGGIPQPVGEAFGLERHKNAVAGSDGLKYYVSMQGEDGTWRLHVYDTRTGMWHTEDQTQAMGFALAENLYCLDAQGGLWLTGNITDPPEGCTEEGDIHWEALFGDYTDKSPNKKGVSKLQIRVELAEGAAMQVWMMFDSDEVWREAGRLSATRKRTFQLPVIPRRADHYKLKLTGTGEARIYAITREYYSGSAMRSLPGRQ